MNLTEKQLMCLQHERRQVQKEREQLAIQIGQLQECLHGLAHWDAELEGVLVANTPTTIVSKRSAHTPDQSTLMVNAIRRMSPQQLQAILLNLGLQLMEEENS